MIAPGPWKTGRRPVQPAAWPALLCLLLTACQHPPAGPPPTRYEFNAPQMGVPFRIVLYSADPALARTAAQAAFERIEELNGLLSDYDLESELSRLSRGSGQGIATPVSPDLWFLLNRSQTLARETGGAFDITVGPAIHLWRKARREHRFPTTPRLEQARRSIGYTNLHLLPPTQQALLTVPDMRLDLGGIAKGYAVDAALLVLKTNGIHQALVSGGGDLAVGAPPPGRSHWQIEIAPIDITNAPPASTALLAHAALATSGDMFQRLEIDGTRYSHIVDPRTAIGLTHHALVTVIAPDCTTADSLATAVSVLGPGAGLDFIKRHPEAQAQIVHPAQGRILLRRSARFENYLQ